MSKLIFALAAVSVIALLAWLARPSSSSAASTLAPPVSGPQFTATPTPTGFIPTASYTVTPTSVIPDCRPTWTRNDSSVAYHPLQDIDALSYDTSWAISTTGVLRWDGSAWNPIPHPTPTGALSHTLLTVSAWSPNEAWIGGFYQDSNSTEQPLLMRWDGSAWAILPVSMNGYAHPGGQAQFRIYGIAAVADHLAYAVGSGGFSAVPPIFLCTATQCTSDPHPGLAGRLLDVAGTGPNDVWAVGESPGGATVIEHYGTTAWSLVTTPNMGSVNAVTAIAPDDVWVGGGSGLMHWDGSTWTWTTPFPYVLHLTSVSSNDVWATTGPDASLRHWDGTSWTINHTLPGDPFVQGISAHAPDDVWVITTESGLPFQGAFYHYSTTQRFTDIPSGSTFHPYVQPLACRGVIAGYPCGGPGEPCDLQNRPYFRPQNNVTRGQLSKIVSLAAGYAPVPDLYVFEDVPPGSTFHPYIVALSLRGPISGYPCGGDAEPCVPPSNRDYFRPGALATRGQISKIVAITGHYTDPLYIQIFEDVLPGSTFYSWIQSLASRGIISGYPCGGPGEPCGPENHPYFRPGANVTRGQISKIVVNTFFP